MPRGDRGVSASVSKLQFSYIPAGEEESEIFKCYQEIDDTIVLPRYYGLSKYPQLTYHHDGIITARLRLAEVMIVGRRHDEALEVLRAVLERDPGNELAGRRLGKIVFERPGLLEARLLLIDLLIELEDLEGAENGAQWILDSDPDHPGAKERMERIRRLQ